MPVFRTGERRVGLASFPYFRGELFHAGPPQPALMAGYKTMIPMLRSKRLLATVLISTALFAFGAEASAGDLAAAGRAYKSGQSAQMAGDDAKAAEMFELANSLMPSATALRSAARARYSAGDLATAGGHAEGLIAMYPGDESSHELASKMLQKIRPQFLRVALSCDVSCAVLADDRVVSLEASLEHVFYLPSGSHEIVAETEEGGSANKPVAGEAGENVRLSLSPKAPEKPVEAEPEAASVRFSPATGIAEHRTPILIGGVVLTGLAASASLWSLWDTQQAKDDYVDSPSRAGFDDGSSRQFRSNILMGTTGLFAVATIVGYFMLPTAETESGGETGFRPNGFGGTF